MMEEMGLAMMASEPKNDDSSGNDGSTAGSNSSNTKNNENDFEFGPKPTIQRSFTVNKKNSAEVQSLEAELERLRLVLEE